MQSMSKTFQNLEQHTRFKFLNFKKINMTLLFWKLNSNAWKKLLPFKISILVLSLLYGACSNDEQILKSALRYFKEGNSAYLHRDYQNAIWNYRKAITMDTETPEFYFNLGLVYYELGNFPEALDAYKRTAELQPRLSDVYYNIALVYHRMEKSNEADRYYTRYQDMLSLRKAKEMARIKAEEAQIPKDMTPVNTSSNQIRIQKPNARKKPVIKKSNPALASSQNNSSKLKFSSPPRGATNKIPSWE